MRPYNPPAYTNSAVIYQVNLRAFTNEGTLSAAAKLLPHIKSIGADIAYLCPNFVHDDDETRDGWSARQKASGLNNPKNPYRMKDYFHTDSEYGSDDDLRAFIDAAHKLGLRVMLDLVYFHCGPTAVFLEGHPDFIVRNEDGTPALGEWCFPKLNYNNPALCEYMWSNMEYYVREFDVDGYRCDVGDAVPLAFWEEGRRRIDAIKPDLLMLNEGTRKDFIGVFDLNYDFGFSGAMVKVLRDGQPASTLAEYREKFQSERLGEGMSILCFENHDIASDAYDNRLEKALGSDAVDIMLLLMYTLKGVPMLYNGNEVCDSRRHSIWGNRFHGANLTIDWQNALTERGQARMDYLRKLADIHKTIPAVRDGSMKVLVSDGATVIAYERETDGQRVICAANMSGGAVACAIDAAVTEGVPLLSRGAAWSLDGELRLSLEPYGFAVLEVK